MISLPVAGGKLTKANSLATRFSIYRIGRHSDLRHTPETALRAFWRRHGAPGDPICAETLRPLLQHIDTRFDIDLSSSRGRPSYRPTWRNLQRRGGTG